MFAHGSFATTLGGHTALYSGAATGQEASPLRISISMLISLAPLRYAHRLVRKWSIARTKHENFLTLGFTPMPVREPCQRGLNAVTLLYVTGTEPSIRGAVKPNCLPPLRT